MNILYQIQAMAPLTDGRGCPIQINLWPGWKDAVARYDLDQAKVNHVIESMHRPWLDGCGYDRMYDPERTASERIADKKPLGPKARKLYDVHSIRVQWGTWGPEHITVPGDACGLDISRSIGGARGGMSLLPHNVDHMRQAYLLLVVFTWFADAIICNEKVAEHKRTIPSRSKSD